MFRTGTLVSVPGVFNFILSRTTVVYLVLVLTEGRSFSSPDGMGVTGSKCNMERKFCFVSVRLF